PTISVANPANAPVPVRKLTEIGGQFPAWSADGTKVHWSIGNAHFVYDLDEARAVDERVRLARRERRSQPDRAAADADSTKAGADPAGEPAKAAPDTAAADTAAAPEEERYVPAEHRILVQVERDIPQGVVVLRGARIITMRGYEIIEDGDLVVRDNRIVAVGRRGEVPVPEEARIIDVAGKTIVPGYVDTHAHLRPSFNIHRD